MLIYTIRQFLSAIPTLLILAALTFFLIRMAPGGPFDTNQVWPPEVQANILHRYELDLPLVTQFSHWLQGVFRGDLRESFQYIGRPVSEILSESFPISAQLGGWALLLSIGLGIPLGCIAAGTRKPWIRRVILGISLSGLSLPGYLVASLLVLIFSVELKWLPPALWEGPTSAILPILTLSWRPMAIISQMTRVSLLEVLGADYIRTAYGKGVSPLVVLLKHGLKNSLIPVITLLGPVAANLLTGSFLVEVVFQIPGMGKHFVQAVLNRDYPLVMGVTLIYGVVLILSNLVSDLAYAWVDPRIRLGET